MKPNTNSAQWMMLLMLLMAVCAVCFAQDAIAETIGGTSANADVGAAPPPDNHWELQADFLNGQAFLSLSTDTVLPLPMWLSGFVDPATALQYVSVSVTANSAAEPTPGTLSYHQDLRLVLWNPSQPLSPETTYSVTVVVDNEGLGATSWGTWPNVGAQFTFTTASGVLALGPQPIIEDMIVYSTTSSEWVYCPFGQVYCDSPGNCSPGVSYEVPYLDIDLRWQDGEDVNTQLFFAYTALNMDTQALLGSLSGLDVFVNSHAQSLYTAQPPNTDRVCIELHTIDLRSVARGTVADETRTLVRCAEFSPIPASDPEAILARCEPDPSACLEPDGDLCPFSDTTTTSDTASSTSGSDATTGTDSSSGDGSNSDGACGCTSTRRHAGAPPLGLLAGIAAVAGAGLLLTGRRQKHTT